MTRDQIRAILETVSRQAGILDVQRRAYVAGAEWMLANLSESYPTTMRSAEEVREEIEYKTKSAMVWKETNGPIGKNAARDCEVRVSALRWALNEEETGR